MKARIILSLQVNRGTDELDWEDEYVTNIVEYRNISSPQAPLDDYLKWKQMMEQWYFSSRPARSYSLKKEKT